jgi:L-ascorbate metabolism protein UlaG (beta-lactamase superfamily)
MKPAFQKDAAFIADVRRVLAARKGALWWLGQSGFLLARDGRLVVLDPYLSDSLTAKYAQTDKPHVRISERVVSPEDLGELGVIDLITSSHNHTDHFDPETLLPLLALNPKARLALPAANRATALQRIGVDFAERLVDLDAGSSAQIGPVEIHGIAAAHPTVERDANGRCRFLGYVLRWGDRTIYHSGDTVWHEGLEPALKKFKIDMALLPINGDRPERRVAGNLDGRQAATLAKAMGAGYVVPCHFDMFEFNTASPDDFVQECRRLDQRFEVVPVGGRVLGFES